MCESVLGRQFGSQRYQFRLGILRILYGVVLEQVFAELESYLQAVLGGVSPGSFSQRLSRWARASWGQWSDISACANRTR